MSGTDSPWKVYTRLLGFARPYRGLLLLAGVGMLLEAGAGGAFAKLMESVVDETFIKRDEAKSLLLPAYIVGLFVIRGVAGYITDMGMGKAARSIARDFRVEVLGKYLRLPGLRFDAEPVPSMLVRLGSDSDQVAQAAVDAQAVADDIHRRFAGAADACRRLPPQDRRLTGYDEPMILNGAYLVDDREGERFRSTVEAFALGLSDVRLTVDGPWPPYSFTSLESA